MLAAFLISLGVCVLVQLLTTPRPKKRKQIADPVEQIIEAIEPGLSAIDQLDDTKIANDAFIDRAIDFWIAAGMTDRQAEKLVTDTYAKMIPGCTLRELLMRCLRTVNDKKRKKLKRTPQQRPG